MPKAMPRRTTKKPRKQSRLQPTGKKGGLQQLGKRRSAGSPKKSPSRRKAPRAGRGTR